MHGLRGMLLSRRKGTLLKIRGCRSFFGISLSITPQVPFPYLRLRKKLEASYSAIRPKWAGNRDFCARTTPGGPTEASFRQQAFANVAPGSGFTRLDPKLRKKVSGEGKGQEHTLLASSLHGRDDWI